MSTTGAGPELPRLPRVESVVTEGRAERPAATGYRAFGVAADDFARHLAMFEVRKRTGNRCAFAYHLLARVDWDPSHGIELIFSDTTVTLRGRNLAPIFTAIRDQRAAWVQEADQTILELVAPAAVLIESVVIETRATVW